MSVDALLQLRDEIGATLRANCSALQAWDRFAAAHVDHILEGG